MEQQQQSSHEHTLTSSLWNSSNRVHMNTHSHPVYGTAAATEFMSTLTNAQSVEQQQRQRQQSSRLHKLTSSLWNSSSNGVHVYTHSPAFILRAFQLLVLVKVTSMRRWTMTAFRSVWFSGCRVQGKIKEMLLRARNDQQKKYNLTLHVLVCVCECVYIRVKEKI